MAAVAEQKPRRWTYKEYSRLEDEQRYEIIDGKLFGVPDSVVELISPSSVLDLADVD